jgi:anti-sigma factor RsiW
MEMRKHFDHRFAQRRMSDYVDGDLSPRKLRRIERHSDACPECGPLRRALTRLVRELRELRTRTADRDSVAPTVVEPIREHDELT